MNSARRGFYRTWDFGDSPRVATRLHFGSQSYQVMIVHFSAQRSYLDTMGTVIKNMHVFHLCTATYRVMLVEVHI